MPGTSTVYHVSGDGYRAAGKERGSSVFENDQSCPIYSQHGPMKLRRAVCVTWLSKRVSKVQRAYALNFILEGDEADRGP